MQCTEISRRKLDDGFISLPSVDEVVSLVHELFKNFSQEAGLRLLKIIPNSNEVKKSLPVEDIAKKMSPGFVCIKILRTKI